MKNLLLGLLLLLVLATGCSSNTVFVRVLEAPKWPVSPERTIGVLAVLEDKQGRNAHLTRDLVSIIHEMLKQSAYYTKVEKTELTEGTFEIGKTGERLPDANLLAQLSEKMNTSSLLFIEVLDSNMWVDLGSRIGYSVGFGRWHGNTAFGTSLGSGSEYWNANARMLISITLANLNEKKVVASTVEGHSFYRSYMDAIPSESDVFLHMVRQATSRIITYVDVYFHLEPRKLISDGSKLVTDGIHYALLGKFKDWEMARHFWLRELSVRPGSLAINYNLGVASEINEEFEKAVDYYLNARDITGIPESFSLEIEQATHSAEVLKLYGSLEEVVDTEKKDTEPEKSKK